MGWPQVIWIIIAGIRLGVHIARHGEPMNQRYHAGARLVGVAMMGGLLYWGGFFG